MTASVTADPPAGDDRTLIAVAHRPSADGPYRRLWRERERASRWRIGATASTEPSVADPAPTAAATQPTE